MKKLIDKNAIRVHRHKRIRNHISGTSARPRLCVFRSNKHISAQIIDDAKQVTLASASSLQLKLANGSNIEAAKEVGKAIAEEIKNFPRIKIEKSTWYKARNIDKENVSKIFTKKDMDQVPAKDAKEERYSHTGQSALYVGNLPLTCLAEINNGNIKGICWMQNFQIETDNIIDLTDFMISDKKIDGCPLFIASLLINGLTSQKDETNSNGYYKPEYAITRFIADLCRQNGIHGIKYPSASFKIQDSDDPFNLVLFGDTSKYKEFIGEPYIFNGEDHIISECKMDGCDTVIQFICKTSKTDIAKKRSKHWNREIEFIKLDIEKDCKKIQNKQLNYKPSS